LKAKVQDHDAQIEEIKSLLEKELSEEEPAQEEMEE